MLTKPAAAPEGGQVWREDGRQPPSCTSTAARTISDQSGEGWNLMVKKAQSVKPHQLFPTVVMVRPGCECDITPHQIAATARLFMLAHIPAKENLLTR